MTKEEFNSKKNEILNNFMKNGDTYEYVTKLGELGLNFANEYAKYSVGDKVVYYNRVNRKKITKTGIIKSRAGSILKNNSNIVYEISVFSKNGKENMDMNSWNDFKEYDILKVIE